MDNTLGQYINLANENRQLLDGNSFDGMNALRAKAFDALSEATLPKLHDEGNVYTSPTQLFAPDYGLNLNRLPFQADVAEAFRCDVSNLSTLLGVVVNDTFHSSASLVKNLPEGVEFCSLRKAAELYPELVNSYLGSLAPLSQATVALNTLLAQDGVFVHIGKNVKMTKPLQLVNIFNASVALMGVRRLLVIAEQGAEASLLLCDHTQSQTHQFLGSTVIEVFLEDNAKFSLYDIESATANTSRHVDLYVRQQDKSELTLGCFTLAGGVTRNNINVTVDGKHCDTKIYGMAIAGRGQIVDNNVKLSHNAPCSTSSQLFKYVLDDDARGAFEGRILVKEGASATEAYQTNRNILASDNARMHTEPQLEIYCDDVKCSHGASSGQLDSDALFYMQTRGIPEHEARVMLMQAFMTDIIDSIKMESLRQRMHLLVERRFNGDGASCAECQVNCQK